MNTATIVCASSCATMQWPDIDWVKCIRNIRRLQVRIVKATQVGRWNKVKALQRLLTSSFSSKALAVKRVTENEGGKTAGVDGQIWSTPEAKSQAVQNLKGHGYHPLPLRRVYIPKSRDKMRPLGIPTTVFNPKCTSFHSRNASSAGRIPVFFPNIILFTARS